MRRPHPSRACGWSGSTGQATDYHRRSQGEPSTAGSKDAVAVADYLDIDRFYTAGTFTGGAYALALAAIAGGRVDGVVACCAITDMRFKPARDTMSRPHVLDIWEAEDRDQAMAAAIASHGIDGTKIIESADGPPLSDTDLAMLNHPWGRCWMDALPHMFAQGVEGYTDDRLTDREGWTTFDVEEIRCPVIVLHGSDDVIADPIHAQHTASIIRGAECGTNEIQTADALAGRR